MKPSLVLRGLALLLGLTFILILSRSSSGGLATRRGPDILMSVTISFRYGLKLLMNEQCIRAKMYGPPARASPFCCVYMEDFQPS